MVSSKESKIPKRDPLVNPLFNPLRIAREALVPLEFQIQRAANNLQFHWLSLHNFNLFQNNHRVNTVKISKEKKKKNSQSRVLQNPFWGSFFKKESKGIEIEGRKALPLELLIGFVFDHLFRSLNKWGQRNQGENGLRITEQECGKTSRVLANLGFASMGGSKNLGFEDHGSGNGDNESSSPMKVALPLSNKEVVKLVNQIEWSCEGYHDEKNVGSVEEFFRSQDATVDAVAPPVAIPAESVLKSALAGGLACALSAFLMHPVETVKTRVQASTISLPELVLKLPQIGWKGLYRGSIPSVLGQFTCHGLRTGIFEASKLLIINIAPTVPEIQVQSFASFCGTILGTTFRIPSEVVKQRLQAGIFDNVGEAIVGTFQRDGIKGFFCGTGATLCREVPFYVAGMGLYEESKKATQWFLRRDLEPWETMMVGALSGGFAAIFTTPFDVIKTRMMTAPPGAPATMTTIAFSILHTEGPLGLFKGAVPRFFWIAPLGALNLAGYDLAKNVINNIEYLGTTTDQLLKKKPAKAR